MLVVKGREHLKHTLSEYLGRGGDSDSYTLPGVTKEDFNNLMKSDAAIVIEYLNKVVDEASRKARVDRVLTVIAIAVGVLTLAATITFGLSAILG